VANAALSVNVEYSKEWIKEDAAGDGQRSDTVIRHVTRAGE